jgi:hypothetical protein
MPDLNFQVLAATPQEHAAAPLLLFRLRIDEIARGAAVPTSIHSIMLRCQVRIEPGRRRYSPEEQAKLLDLFGTPERWGQTVRPMLWTHVQSVVPAFTGSCTVDLPVPCNHDFNLAATRYFTALDDGHLPLCFLFSGTIFYETLDAALQVAQVPWEKEASFRLPAATWRHLIDLYYPDTAWLGLRRDVFDLLNQYRSRAGLPTFEQALQRLLLTAEEPVAS